MLSDALLEASLQRPLMESASYCLHEVLDSGSLYLIDLLPEIDLVLLGRCRRRSLSGGSREALDQLPFAALSCEDIDSLLVQAYPDQLIGGAGQALGRYPRLFFLGGIVSALAGAQVFLELQGTVRNLESVVAVPDPALRICLLPVVVALELYVY